MGRIIFGACVLFFNLNHAVANNLSFQDWLTQERAVSVDRILKQVSVTDGKAGTVVASPSRQDPDYYYHWVRDASLVMNAIRTQNVGGSAVARSLILDFAKLSAAQQSASGFDGIGEPKYYVDGAPYTGPWGRPQNDGPALRAIVLSEFGLQLLKEKRVNLVTKYLYNMKSPDASVIKQDLEYTAQKWMNPCFDLWEEVLGEHFFTLMVQRKALFVGAQFMKVMGDGAAASHYLKQAALISQKLETFVTKGGWVQATLNSQSALAKPSGLDASVLLGSVIGSIENDSFGPLDPRIQLTWDKIKTAFLGIYPISANTTLGVPIGRYPEDSYYGGNPWFLTTLGAAEFLSEANRLQIQSGKVGAGKANMNEIKMRHAEVQMLLQRVQFHAPFDLRLSEQYSRDNGYMLSAVDLTWSYASYLTAESAFSKVESALSP